MRNCTVLTTFASRVRFCARVFPPPRSSSPPFAGFEYETDRKICCGTVPVEGVRQLDLAHMIQDKPGQVVQYFILLRTSPQLPIIIIYDPYIRIKVDMHSGMMHSSQVES